MPKLNGLTIQQWKEKAERAEKSEIDLSHRLQFHKSLVEEQKRKINQLRRDKRELMK